MRFTYSIAIEVNASAVFPNIYDDPKRNEKFRKEIARIEIEESQGATGSLWRAQRLAEDMAQAEADRLNFPANWRDFGQATVELVENRDLLPTTHGLEAPDKSVVCPECGKPMKLRKGRNEQPFYGCSSFPECRGSRPISK